MIPMNNKLLPICLLIIVLGHASLSQEDATKKNDLAAREAALKRSMDAALPIVEDANLSIDITEKKDTFAGGESVQIDVTLKNNGASKTRLVMVPLEVFYDVEVVGPFGAVPKLSSSSSLLRRFAGSDEGFNLSRTRSKSGSIILSNLFDMAVAGTYKIKVSKRFRLKDAKGQPVTIASNTLEVKVTSDAPISQWN